jgi:hypothetical protein
VSSQVRIIILCYKRWNNVNLMVKALHRYYPITVINNLPGHTYSNQNAEVINNDVNKYCMERWLRCYEYNEPFKIVLDDDILVNPRTIEKLVNNCVHISGIFGYSSVNRSKNYFELERVFNERSAVDFLVGSVMCVRQSSLNLIKDDLLEYGLPLRGDDIIVSYLMKQKFKLEYLSTIGGAYINLPELEVGLNTQTDHYKLRWQVIENFKKLGWT